MSNLYDDNRFYHSLFFWRYVCPSLARTNTQPLSHTDIHINVHTHIHTHVHSLVLMDMQTIATIMFVVHEVAIICV